MGICAKEFNELVIKPTLTLLSETGTTTTAQQNLLLGTAAQETGLGFHLKVNRGHGIGVYQITPKTHLAIWDKYLINYPSLASDIRGLASQQEFLAHPHAELATNLSYATAIAWMIYRRNNKPLPDAGDTEAMARYWARYFHYRQGANVEQFCQRYKEFVEPGSKKVSISENEIAA